MGSATRPTSGASASGRSGCGRRCSSASRRARRRRRRRPWTAGGGRSASSRGCRRALMIRRLLPFGSCSKKDGPRGPSSRGRDNCADRLRRAWPVVVAVQKLGQAAQVLVDLVEGGLGLVAVAGEARLPAADAADGAGERDRVAVFTLGGVIT